MRDAGIIDGSKRYFFLLLKRMHMYTVEEELLLYMISLYNKLKVSLCYQTEDLYKADWRSATNSSRRNKKKKKNEKQKDFPELLKSRLLEIIQNYYYDSLLRSTIIKI